MRYVKLVILLALCLGGLTVASAKEGPRAAGAVTKPSSSNNDQLQYRDDCDNAVRQIDQAINNVRARLLTGGDVWWDGQNGRYVVPKVPPGVPEVSSIFAGAVWLGGFDPNDNLQIAAQQYGRNNGSFDFYTGPLDPITGKTNKDQCTLWDKFFTVEGENIDIHIAQYLESIANGTTYDPATIPVDVLGWPGRGNPFFFDVHQFDLPNTSQGLAGFYDQDGDGLYNPVFGDYPIIEIRGCPDPQYPDEMIFWIYNDAGNTHQESGSDFAIQMEVQVQAFSYATNDEINDMTFQRYKLINRALESIDSCFFAMWVDADLGCSSDDYIGCDTLRSLAYVYNEDAADGEPGQGCVCNDGINTYCTDIPILGVDYFRGPLDELGNELGMSSFTYANRDGTTPPPPGGTTDPGNAQEYYNYLSGSWRDGTPFTFGGNAYAPGSPGAVRVNYAFPDEPDNNNGWSMCSETLAPGDRRTIQASGPFRLDPGAVNELIIGVVWVADLDYPCPNIRRLLEADDIAQALFDNCFEITDGPDAPDIDWIELDREVIAVLTNDENEALSNNAFEAYSARGLEIPAFVEDSTYKFEGYRLYQLAGPEVTLADLDDPDKAREIFTVDVKNGIGRIFNWEVAESPTVETVYVPVEEVNGADEGIRHTFSITRDQFSTGDPIILNHKKYYFTAVAYAHNEYAPFDPGDVVGQRQPYLEGRNNIGDGDNPFYTVIPRPIVDRQLNAQFGEGTLITRVDGVGTGGNFLDLEQDTRDVIATAGEAGESVPEIPYAAGRAPITVTIFNPLDVVDGEFELAIVDNDLTDDKVEDNATWILRNLSDPSAADIVSDRSIDFLNEQVIREYGFTITVGQVDEVGSMTDDRNGITGFEIEYIGNTGVNWVSGLPDFTDLTPFLAVDNEVLHYVRTLPEEPDASLDPNRSFTTFLDPGYFVPYELTYFRNGGELDIPYLSPGWTNVSAANILRNRLDLQELNNVDIVLTSDKSKWSRCPVVETMNRFYTRQGLTSEGDVDQFDLRQARSVTKEADADGNPIPESDPDDIGMGWFPGYAIDVETGQRLEIFFGENSVYNGTFFDDLFIDPQAGGDMMFNPNRQLFVPAAAGNPFEPQNLPIFNYYAGGQHYIYVTRLPYDAGETLREKLAPSPSPFGKITGGLEFLTWTGIIVPDAESDPFLSYADGLIPNDVVLKLRVNNPYQVEEGTSVNDGYPTYQFSLDGKAAQPLEGIAIENALDTISAVPNPYYGFSDYETSQFTKTVKITNLPAKCTVTIYSLDGKFIRQYNRDEVGSIPGGNNRAITRNQIIPDLEWDLNNSKGIPIAAGVYLIHVDAPGLGERTIKWFGVNRQFDPSGL